MAILSMTGFGKSESMYQGASCVIEVRSVNNRFLDISCKLPKNLAYLENSFKNQIKDKLVTASLLLTNHGNYMFGAKVREANGRQELAELVFVLVADFFNFQTFLVAKGVEIL